VPLHAEDPGERLVLDRLDQPVLRPRDHAKSLAQPFHRLVMERVDAQHVTLHDAVEQ